MAVYTDQEILDFLLMFGPRARTAGLSGVKGHHVPPPTGATLLLESDPGTETDALLLEDDPGDGSRPLLLE